MTNFNKQASAFLRSHKSHTKAAVSITLAGIEHILAHKDWTGMARVLSGVDPRFAHRMRQIIGKSLGGVDLRTKGKDYVFKLGENFGATDYLENLRVLVAGGVSIFSEDMDKFLELEPKGAQAFDLQARALNIAKKAIASDADMSERAFLEAMLAAYRAAMQAKNAGAVPATA